ncbi:MAG: CDP-diacylglycerol--glycerol-3-phosphate 3-phosphatidyltransferase [Lachnospiraceae bacterium]|nr:CDP-diacylglycerol--glycerol-3-phosphate 3-phosphatidyltransferase [Lachnospiraceae bacterium]
MNLPNKLTTFRVVLIPFFIFFLMTDVAGTASKWIALGIFIIASLTDFFDGYIARKQNLITNFGKFMDPLADKLLVSAAMICFVELGRMPAWIVVVIIAREFFISGFRLVAAEQGIVIAAGWWGKFKTAFQMFMVIFMIMDLAPLQIVTMVLMYIALALTLISMIDYVVKNKTVLKEQK